MNLLMFISFINNQFSITKNVINVESFFFIIELINNCESNKESSFFQILNDFKKSNNIVI